MTDTPIYDPKLSYEENYDTGPFGAFADGKILEQKGEPTVDFLGQKVYVPFGIPSGPLLNSRFIKAAFEKGFDLCVYKTVRSNSFPCHPFPNVLAIHEEEPLSIERLKKPLVADANFREPLSITNSFGVPSKDPTIWQEDAKKAMNAAGKGQVVILSFMGTVKKDQTQQAFINDYVLAAKLAYETGAKVLETNLSCPNIGNEGLVCYNIDVTKHIAAGIRKVIGNTPLILKVGYYKDEAMLEKIAEITNAYANSLSGINTLQAEIRDESGNQALPGEQRLRSGICGAGIKWAGIDFVTRARDIRERRNFSFSIEGIGGVMTTEDYVAYRTAGADSVMSATGSMWHPLLAQQIKNLS